ncbi:MAG: sigma-70 family RNA polymerase sigma factor [Anaerolineales bacterium]|nr:sigma-70 family RNA polymerase sigma factor [Anaerolineales bacterium]MCB8953463.1 sigma-70 family RNA polymerase sigma factor [Ardenticatenales bacterium]
MSNNDNLVQRCQQGELAAFSELFRIHEVRIYRLALVILGNEEDAEDAVQDAFIRILERIKSYRGDSSFETWMTRLVVNLCRDKLRRLKVRHALSLDWIRGLASDHNLPRELDERMERQRLWGMVSQLDDKYRLPVILRYHENLSCDEIAAILNVRTTTVYARLNTARQRLRDMAQDGQLAEKVEAGYVG